LLYKSFTHLLSYLYGQLSEIAKEIFIVLKHGKTKLIATAHRLIDAT